MLTNSVYEIRQDRWACQHCGASGWWIPSRHVGRPPTQEHDRPDGRKCLLAGLSAEEAAAYELKRAKILAENGVL